MQELLSFVVDHLKIFSENWLLFVLFAVIVSGIVVGIYAKIHKYFIEKRLYNLPEREEMAREIAQLKAENARLSEIIRDYDTSKLLLGGNEIEDTAQSQAGTRISAALSEL